MSGKNSIREKTAAPSAARPGGEGSDNLVDLVRQLTQQGSHLAEQQLSLVKAEVRESVGEVKVAVGSLAGAAVVGIAGLGVALMGIAFLITSLIENVGLATLLVGAVTLLVAYILYSAGKKKMQAAELSPDRSRRTMERTIDAARGALTPEQTR